MAQHFEDLWEQAEKAMQEETSNSESAEIVKEIQAKLNVYSALNSAGAMLPKDVQRLKIHTMGKVMLALTQLASKDGIDVYRALEMALNEAQISQLEDKYK